VPSELIVAPAIAGFSSCRTVFLSALMSKVSERRSYVRLLRPVAFAPVV